jgi:hypothetical protein
MKKQLIVAPDTDFDFLFHEKRPGRSAFEERSYGAGIYKVNDQR